MQNDKHQEEILICTGCPGACVCQWWGSLCAPQGQLHPGAVQQCREVLGQAGAVPASFQLAPACRGCWTHHSLSARSAELIKGSIWRGLAQYPAPSVTALSLAEDKNRSQPLRAAALPSCRAGCVRRDAASRHGQHHTAPGGQRGPAPGNWPGALLG